MLQFSSVANRDYIRDNAYPSSSLFEGSGLFGLLRALPLSLYRAFFVDALAERYSNRYHDRTDTYEQRPKGRRTEASYSRLQVLGDLIKSLQGV
jgi:hypothetical protein